MATNVKYDRGSNVRLELTVGASQTKGSVILISQMPVFLLEASDSANKAPCILPGSFVAELAVTGANAGGNSAVAVGDRLYKDGTEINKDATNGVSIGYALATVGSGATATIQVLMFA
ncbi:MAG: hypothetical protein BroJett018_16550 [Chloroflexota bacterium]|nr:hypothetical protein [Chloroflexota bacterium]NOG65660.1 hypothetical protein [Chloroflexota bacterium]GIK63861.1 MAG: hypothetical protein BroJett018_16550 [Chloroflexota bacterium]